MLSYLQSIVNNFLIWTKENLWFINHVGYKLINCILWHWVEGYCNAYTMFPFDGKRKKYSKQKKIRFGTLICWVTESVACLFGYQMFKASLKDALSKFVLRTAHKSLNAALNTQSKALFSHRYTAKLLKLCLTQSIVTVKAFHQV